MSTILLGSASILVQSVIKQLTDYGYIVLTATSMAEAVEKLSHNQVCFILVDLHLSDNDAVEFINTVRNNPEWARIALGVMSGDLEDETCLISFNLSWIPFPPHAFHVLEIMANYMRPILFISSGGWLDYLLEDLDDEGYVVRCMAELSQLREVLTLLSPCLIVVESLLFKEEISTFIPFLPKNNFALITDDEQSDRPLAKQYGLDLITLPNAFAQVIALAQKFGCQGCCG